AGPVEDLGPLRSAEVLPAVRAGRLRGAPGGSAAGRLAGGDVQGPGSRPGPGGAGAEGAGRVRGRPTPAGGGGRDAYPVEVTKRGRGEGRSRRRRAARP